jgi:hypothetical protein
MDQTMIKTTTAVASFVLLSCGPSLATDYVQCREMLRTKNEVLLKARNTEAKIRGEYFAEILSIGITGQMGRGRQGSKM